MLTAHDTMDASHKGELGALLQAHSLHHDQGSAIRGQGGDRGPDNAKDRKMRLDLRQIFG